MMVTHINFYMSTVFVAGLHKLKRTPTLSNEERNLSSNTTEVSERLGVCPLTSEVNEEKTKSP